MPRTRQFTMDGCTVTIAALSYDKTMEHFKTGKAMAAADPKPTEEEWANRTVEIVVWSLNRGQANNNGTTWTVEKVRDEFDMLFIRKLHEEIMELTTGVKPQAETGEVLATSTGA